MTTTPHAALIAGLGALALKSTAAAPDIAEGAVGAVQLAAGTLVQRSTATDGTWATVNGATEQIPGDDTIPQATEGHQVIACTITPKSATNILRITARIGGLQTAAANTTVVLALFRDGGADAIAAGMYEGDASTNYSYQITWEVTAGSVAATTFRLRLGPTSNCNLYLHGASGGRLFGGVMRSIMTIDEIKG